MPAQCTFMFKHLFDFFFSLIIICILSLLLVFVALLILILMGKPVLFKQERPGLYGKPFYLYKFRTMTDKRDVHGNLLSDDLRLTPIGRLLRRFSIDELPQFFNVLEGHLSLVGPRPLLMEYLPLYSSEQFRRHNVKPGITGWAQVNGRNALSWEEKFKLDVWYVDNWSIWLDIKILWLTAIKVLNRESINYPGEATMTKFTGSN